MDWETARTNNGLTVNLLPERSVYTHIHYVGSLTTPPTKGPVKWFVFDTIPKMDQAF